MYCVAKCFIDTICSYFEKSAQCITFVNMLDIQKKEKSIKVFNLSNDLQMVKVDGLIAEKIKPTQLKKAEIPEELKTIIDTSIGVEVPTTSRKFHILLNESYGISFIYYFILVTCVLILLTWSCLCKVECFG